MLPDKNGEALSRSICELVNALIALPEHGLNLPRMVECDPFDS